MEIIRFREITLCIYFLLAVFVLLRRNRSSFVREWFSRFREMAGSKHFFPVMAGSMLILYILAALTQHLSFNTYSHDFSMIDEALYNSHSGQFMFSPVLGKNLLGEHFSPILIFLIPLHFVFTTPYLLVLVQPIALWASMLVLKKLLMREGLSVPLVNLACLVYLNNPIMVSTLNYLFHQECFLPLIIFGMFWHCREKITWKYWLMVVFALMIKEDVGLYLLGFSAYLVVADKRYKMGFITALVNVLWIMIAIKVLIPYFGECGGGYKFLARWAYWGNSPVNILSGYFQHPLIFLRVVFSVPYILLFSCMLFMPFYRKWSWLIFFVPWVINSTSSFVLQAKMSIYYGIPVFTFAAVSAVLGFRTTFFKIHQHLSPSCSRYSLPSKENGVAILRGRIPATLVCIAIVLNVSYLTYPAIPGGRLEFIKQLSNIPKGASVQIMSCFYPVLGYRRDKMLLKPGQELAAEYVIIRVDSTTWPFSEREAREMVRTALESGKYENLSGVKGFFVLRRLPVK